MLALFLTASLVCAEPTAKDSAVIALKVDRILVSSGETVEGGYVVMSGGHLQEVGATKAPPGALVLEFPGATACAGFIDPVTGLGAQGNLEEPARAFTPEANAAHSFHPFHSDFKKAAQSGLAAVGLSPTSRNLVGGRLAVVETSGEDDQAALLGDGPLRLAMVDQALSPTREPTSLMGALPTLREMVAEGLPGEGPMLIEASTPYEIRLSLELLRPANRPIVVLGAVQADEALSYLVDAKATAVLGPYSLTTSTRQLRMATLLTEKGIPVAFTGKGNAATLRLTSVLAVREGLSASSALAAMTEVPAQVLGIETKAGTLAKGKRANVLVFDGHPLDLTAKLQAVFVGGVFVGLDDE